MVANAHNLRMQEVDKEFYITLATAEPCVETLSQRERRWKIRMNEKDVNNRGKDQRCWVRSQETRAASRSWKRERNGFSHKNSRKEPHTGAQFKFLTLRIIG